MHMYHFEASNSIDANGSVESLLWFTAVISVISCILLLGYLHLSTEFGCAADGQGHRIRRGSNVGPPNPGCPILVASG
ncbi:hypothetical protein TWF569_003711 [Orbilia oligospora]|uniref:Uncharacterized protein n=1 Tax=Orbilia oligospora TaxID=2813651 RepID=A0A7C8ND82_ORBOL|nr:hypothetical protein TWF102_008573 [Orbilia oligospora]KAF3095451.1 hypothetical protein TWF706_007970 [Orbilia oligospora]KAF3118219.1 hypothetical protein TWF103_000239 [Orbilia oligospora]KAF3130910.1 hypothetical protein TWF594_010191 [Orbilia oligospora]KAF3151578.1 hypothetical protein TWF569_003711 [Orbilia oligospora]